MGGRVLATVLGTTMPAANTMVPASMVSFSSSTPPGLDRPDSCRDLDVNPAPLEHARRRGGQLHVDLWQNPGAGLEQPKANLVAPDARIKALHVVGKRYEFTRQFYANQFAADHDNCQTPAPLRRVRGCIRAFEASDQVIS